MTTSHPQRLPIEEYALLTENAPELGAKLDYWHSFYQPATPGECEWIDLAVMASVQARRVYACLTATVNHQINTAFFDFDREQEDEVDRYRAMLATQPGAAVVGLKRSALGVRFLIGRWERLLRLIQEEGTLYGNDRIEAINYQGARASKPEDLFESEGAYLTWLYCLMCQPAPKDEQFVAMGNEKWMPASLMDRPPAEWLGEDVAVQEAPGGACGARARVFAAAGRAASSSTMKRRHGTVPRSAGRCSRDRKGPGSCGRRRAITPVRPRLQRLPEGAWL